MRGWMAALVVLLALPVLAEAPVTSPRPAPRPPMRPMFIAALPPAPQIVVASVMRPRPRPVGMVMPEVAQPLATAQPDASIRRLSAVHPLRRPTGLAAAPQPAAEPVALAKPERRKKADKASRQGSVCGEASIKGEEIARISSKVKGCGVEDPVRVTSVSGVRLSQAATIDCATAKALRKWVDTGLQPAFGRTKVVELRVAAHYICRSRNNVKGARISEHGRGKAIDISGIVLENGKTMMVAGGFGRDLRRAHKAACGVFGTTLGPGSDGFHEDHMHFDTAGYRNGPYCR